MVSDNLPITQIEEADLFTKQMFLLRQTTIVYSGNGYSEYSKKEFSISRIHRSSRCFWQVKIICEIKKKYIYGGKTLNL